jgi:NAD(P)-dependent dehydrogenase (short-subunit alcohol dehydrogenase family)
VDNWPWNEEAKMSEENQERFLADRVALVTGAAQGNGRAIAAELARRGAELVLVDIDSAGVEQSAELLRQQGGQALPVVADCSRVEEIKRAVAEAVAAHGRIDVLVNNAGIIRVSSFPEVSEADYDATMGLNARGAYFFMQEVVGQMPDGGHIVNIASGAGIDGKTLSPPYAASKAALITMTKTIARVLGPRQITVNAVAPGIIDTPFHEQLDQKIGVGQLGLKPGEFIQQRAADVPLGRIGTAQDVAGVVAFLTSPAAAYITGETVILSGGWVID